MKLHSSLGAFCQRRGADVDADTPLADDLRIFLVLCRRNPFMDDSYIPAVTSTDDLAEDAAVLHSVLEGCNEIEVVGVYWLKRQSETTLEDRRVTEHDGMAVVLTFHQDRLTFPLEADLVSLAVEHVLRSTERPLAKALRNRRFYR